MFGKQAQHEGGGEVENGGQPNAQKDQTAPGAQKTALFQRVFPPQQEERCQNDQRGCTGDEGDLIGAGQHQFHGVKAAAGVERGVELGGQCIAQRDQRLGKQEQQQVAQCATQRAEDLSGGSFFWSHERTLLYH